MCNGCADKPSNEAAERTAHDVLGRAGLEEIVDQGHAALETASSALGHLIRAERAEALGLGGGLAELHRSAARRENRRACRQLEIVAERIDARRKADDWPALVKRTRAEFLEHAGRESLNDAREDVRMRLFERDPGFSGPVSQQVLGLVDRTIEVAGGGDLDKVLGLMYEQCLTARDGFADDRMGRQPASQALFLDHADGEPRIGGGQNVNGWCVALAVCIAWATSSFIASIIICAAVVLCWCCFFPALLFWYLMHMATCDIAFHQGCSTG